MKLYFVVEREHADAFPPIHTYQSELSTPRAFAYAATGSAAGKGMAKLPAKIREALKTAEEKRFFRYLLSCFFVDEKSAENERRKLLAKWNANIRETNKTRAADDQYDLYGDDAAVVRSLDIPDDWTAEDSEIRSVPQPRSCANCALRMVEGDLERRTALGCFVHPDEELYWPGTKICGCWRGKEAISPREDSNDGATGTRT